GAPRVASRAAGGRGPEPLAGPDAAVRDPGTGRLPPLLPADRPAAPPASRELRAVRHAAALAGGGVVHRAVGPLDRLPQDSPGTNRGLGVSRRPGRRGR